MGSAGRGNQPRVREACPKALWSRHGINESSGLAAKARSLADFQKAVKAFKVQLEDDMIVAKHLTTLYSNMLEHNLCRIIEPYSKVQVDYVASKIGLPKTE